MNDSRKMQRALLALPLLHLLLVAVTILAPGEWIRIIAVDPFVVPFLFSGGVTADILFVVVGTLLWFLIGYVGWRSTEDKINSPFGIVFGVFVSLFSIVGVLFSCFVLLADIEGRRFEFVLILQEILVALLWVGALTTSFCCFGAASRKSDTF